MAKRVKVNNNQYIVPTGNDDKCVNLVINQNYNKHHPTVQCLTKYAINNYPSIDSKYIDLQTRICDYINNNCNSINITNNNILITPGSENGLYLINQIFTNSNSKVLVPFPNYPGFTHKVKMFTEYITYHTFYGTYSEYTNFYNIIEDHDIVYISSPNLPLGYEIKDSIKQMIKKHEKVLFIIDEAYFEYGTQKSFVDISMKNLIVVRTFSKAFALAGARIGYLIACEEIIESLKIGHSVKDVLEVSIDMAINVLKHQQYYLSQVCNDKKNWKTFIQQLTSIVNKNDIIYDLEYGCGPYFIMFTKYPTYVCKLFKKYGYLVRDKTNDLKKGCIRISLSTQNIIKDLFKIIKNINGYSKCYDTIYLDIDNTIRNARDSKPINHIAGIINKLHKRAEIIFITDNTSNHKDIKYLLDSNNIQYNDLFTPFKQYNISDEEYNNGYFIRNDEIFITKFPNITYTLMKYINMFKYINIVEDDEYENSSEIHENSVDNIKIPFIGKFKQIIDDIYKNIEITYNIIGKSQTTINNNHKNIIMIGDGQNDFTFARNNNICFKNTKSPEHTLEILKQML